MSKRFVFPFPAIVGQEKAKLALLVNAVNPLIGGVLLRGDKGTGKTTMVRALADILPEIKVVSNCPFNCDPDNPQYMCDNCLEKYMRGEELPVSFRKMKVIDLPLSITIDRLVGTLDFEKAIKEGIRALKPGLLAEANRNILYIDEVNLLDDYVIDVLLDVVAYGWNVIEREGISVKHPCRVILIGSMNPEEGELRPQILDRFGLIVNIEAPMDLETRIEIVKRVEEFWQDPEEFYKKYEAQIRDLRDKIKRAKEILLKVQISDDLLKVLAEAITKLGIKTHRAEIVTVRTAKAIAALDGRIKVNLEDLKKAMELALPHRIKAKPFEKPQKPQEQLQKILNEYVDRGENVDSAEEGERRGKSNLDIIGIGKRKTDGDSDHPGNIEQKFNIEDKDVMIELSKTSTLRYSDNYIPVRGSRDSRKTIINYPHGYQISYIQPKSINSTLDIDIYSTIINAAMRELKMPIKIDIDDLRVRVRRIRVPKLNIILLDSSGSMAVERKISTAKSIVARITKESYIRRSYVSLIVFKGSNAQILTEPTRNYEYVLQILDEVPTGGRTPLSHALYTTINLVNRVKSRLKNNVDIWCYLITDGKANVPLGLANSLINELRMLLEWLKKMSVKFVVYDTRPSSIIDPSTSYIDLFRDYEIPIHSVA